MMMRGYGPKREIASNDIDCAARMPLCKGACCRLWVALAPEDVAEGIIQWNPDLPHLLARHADGSCVHQDPTSHSCTAYLDRPAVCRIYSCKTDRRIWLDFEARIPNPELETQEWSAVQAMLTEAPSVSVHEVTAQLRSSGLLIEEAPQAAPGQASNLS